ncbi:DivIVA domain-containing protein [Candidatus Mycoplasma mahonii]|uniref:DivIVA domain-containing protein n=1 Tax=Candidatus Mycoplasma mahonii TaxID=3004105 RepID=UPI0026F079C7|nr:DivIVA domain-containing protein [Candidatus Mycoplasma mahonii]WKX02333.1 DivIVA domain-containing protein [Candidatus Mycoplasma mahonii]
MKKNFNLKSQEILHKKFATDMAGYSPQEVDGFFDLIIQDYQEYEDIVANYSKNMSDAENLLSDKNEEIEGFKIQITNLKHSLSEAQKNTGHEIMNKLNQLERKIK